MSTSEVITSSAAPSGFRFRRRATVTAVVGVLVAVALAAAVMVGYLDGESGPIRAGSFGGIYSVQDLVMSPDGFSSRLAEGPDATAQLMTSLDNAGSRKVEVMAIDTDAVVTDVRWSVLKTVPGGVISGLPTSWQKFPADIPAHTTIRLLISIHRPAYCHQSRLAADGDDLYGGSHRVHWKSLLRSHITTVDDQITGIHLC
jgi:hypothetical protein